jgi:hypothetical protein
MGIVVVEKSGTGNLAIEAPTVEATIVEEEAEIEEIHVARKWGNKCVL